MLAWVFLLYFASVSLFYRKLQFINYFKYVCTSATSVTNSAGFIWSLSCICLMRSWDCQDKYDKAAKMLCTELNAQKSLVLDGLHEVNQNSAMILARVLAHSVFLLFTPSPTFPSVILLRKGHGNKTVKWESRPLQVLNENTAFS